MIRKMIPVFTAAAISMSITFVVPVAITAVSSVTFVSEAQAWGGLKKIKRVAKRRYKKTKRKVINTKNIVTGKRCKGGKWINGHGLCGFSVDPVNGTIRTVKRKWKKMSEACVALGSCQGTITRGASSYSKVTVKRR